MPRKPNSGSSPSDLSDLAEILIVKKSPSDPLIEIVFFLGYLTNYSYISSNVCVNDKSFLQAKLLFPRNEGPLYQLQLLFSNILSKGYPMQHIATITLGTTITISSSSY